MIDILITVIITIILTILYICLSRLHYESKYMNRIIPKISDYNFKSGDIIFMNYSFGKPLINYAVDSYFQHVGIVVRKDNDLYILETGIEGAFYKNSPTGINMDKIPDIFNKNSNIYYVMPINKELDDDKNQKLLEIANRNYLYPDRILLVLDYLLNNKVSDEKQCFDLIAIILNEIGFIDIRSLPVNEQAQAIEKLYMYDILDGYKYNEVLLVG